jgi:predicted acylesterase/phospholipase RssA
MYILIQETTPLAGSSAGAIVCAVVASGASMEEALKATKILAEDCRNRGTAFRLGVCLFFSCAKDILLSTDISRLSNILILLQFTTIHL